MEPRRSKHFLAHIPTIALLVLFAMSPWLGVLFFILRAIDRDAEKKEQENAEYSSDFRSQDTGAGQPARDTEPVYGHDVPTAEQQNAKKWHKTLTNLCTIMGAVFLFAGVTNAVDVISVWKFWPDPGELFSDIAMAIGGGGALLTGLRMKSTRKLERLLDKVVASGITSLCRNCLPLRGGCRPRTCCRRKCHRARILWRGCLHRQPHRHAGGAGRCAPAAQTRRARTRTGSRGSVCHPAAPAPAGQRCHPRPGDDGQDLPAGGCQRPHLRTGKKGPGQKSPAAEIYGLLSATALKLLNTYAQLSAQDVQGTNITEAKQSIERSMDLLITAFENQLDKLFASDALDVSTDIAALEGMLNLDGLTGGDFAPRS